MSYLKCDKCGGYYELQEGESADDFNSCECGGKLKEIESINAPETQKKDEEIKYSMWTGKPLNKSDNSNSVKKPPVKPKEPEKEKINECSNCGTENLESAKYCTKCGSSLGANICPNCKTENPKDAQFCQECARNLKPKTEISKPLVDELEKKKGLDIGEAIVICLFSPIAGAIGFLVWHDKKPQKAQQSCLIAVLAFVILLLAYFAYIFYTAYFSTTSSLDTNSDVQLARSSINLISILFIGG